MVRRFMPILPLRMHSLKPLIHPKELVITKSSTSKTTQEKPTIPSILFPTTINLCPKDLIILARGKAEKLEPIKQKVFII